MGVFWSVIAGLMFVAALAILASPLLIALATGVAGWGLLGFLTTPLGGWLLYVSLSMAYDL